MEAFGYRVMWRTIIPIIGNAWYSLHHGIWNMIRWIPVIWHDEDFDWDGLAKVMEFKLRNMSLCLSNGRCTDSKKHARETLVCAELLHRLREETYYDDAKPITRASVQKAHGIAKHYERLLGKIIGRKLRCWWG